MSDKPFKVRTASGKSLELSWDPSAGAFRDQSTSTLWTLMAAPAAHSTTVAKDHDDTDRYVKPRA